MYPHSPFHATRHDTKNRACVTLTGEIDMDSAPKVRESLTQCLRDGIRTIEVDLSAVTFCDCSGLNAFLAASMLAFTAGGSLQLRYPSPAVIRLLTLTDAGAVLLATPDDGVFDRIAYAV